jgi:rfaE bifunctional protein nucleotidyltransferase chain/domain
MRDELVHESLRVLFEAELKKGFATARDLEQALDKSSGRCYHILTQLRKKGLVRRLKRAEYKLTEAGRKLFTVVLTGGVFDIIHEGHLATLKEAKKLGDFLVVVVARDVTARRLKGSYPINKEDVRLQIVKSLKPVDLALLGDKRDPYKVVKLVKPDIIALGYDQAHKEGEIASKLRELGMETRVVRLTVEVPDVKTSKILSKIVESL